jgi:O-succinylbenzoic acid--CoA ligase
VPRLLTPVVVPRDDRALDLLPRLAAALDGSGPALLLHDVPAAPAASLLPGEALADTEDDATDPTVAVVSTSGSAGEPKGVLLGASALLTAASAGHDRLGGPGRWLLALPADHVAGLMVLVRSLITRTEPVVLDRTAGFDAAGFVDAARRLTGPRRYTALVPTQLRRILAAGPDAVAALAGFDAVLVGGAAVDAGLAERATRGGVRLVRSYGMSETCGGCVYDGLPLDGVRVAVRRSGRVLLSGPMLARGYRAAPAASAEAFRTGPDGARWFHTDDAGRLDGPRLRVLGRLDGGILTGGVTVAPAAVEAAVRGLPGVADAAAFGVPDAEWGERVVVAIVPAAGHAPPGLDDVRRGAGLAPEAAPRQVVVVPELPLRGPGKVDVQALIARALAEERSPREAAAWPR